MLRTLLKRWSDWTGDHSLTKAIHRELRRQAYAVHASQTRNVRLVAIERPGWVQVHRFRVDTIDADQQPLTLLGIARDDGRKERIEVLLTRDADELKRQLADWTEGLILRR